MKFKCPHCGKTISEKLVKSHAATAAGKATAKRGPEYYRKINAMRKTRGGGRPPKEE